MDKFIKKIVIGIIGACLVFSVSALAAAPVHSYGYGFNLPAYEGIAHTQPRTKTYSDAKCWIWLDTITGGGSYALDCYLEGVSDGARNSEYMVVDEGYQRSMTCISAYGGRDYSMRMMNHSSISSSAYVEGYWDTDFR